MTAAAGVRAAGTHDPDDPGHVDVHRGALHNVRRRDLAVRFAFGAAVSVAAGGVGLAAGPTAGGVFLAFPAILGAALTLIESREGTSEAVSEARGAAVGSMGMIVFATAVVALVGRIPGVAALLVAAVAWLMVATSLYAIGVRLAGLLGEQVYLPDVAAVEVLPAVEAVRRAGATLAVAESCTGGALAGLLTAVPNAWDVIRGGIVAYGASVKMAVSDASVELFECDGVVSSATAIAMAQGVCRALRADVGIGVSGSLETPSESHPPGLVFVCATGPRGVRVRSIRNTGRQEAIRAQAIRLAVSLCLEVVGVPEP